MADYAKITNSGMQFDSFQSIRDSIKEDWKLVFGSELDVSPTSPDGHHIDLEARTVYSITKLLQSVLANFNRNTAEGEWLDILASFLGVNRGDGQSDEDLRNEICSTTIYGLATIDGMRSYLQDKLDTSNVSVSEVEVENKFLVVVPVEFSSKKDEVATYIWQCKPAGITGKGNVEGTATDSVGNKHTVKFSIPEAVTIYVSVDVISKGSKAGSEAANEIKTSIVEWANKNLTIGVPVSAGKLEIPCYDVEGIYNVSAKIGKSSSSLSNTVIELDADQYGSITSSNITVTGV